LNLGNAAGDTSKPLLAIIIERLTSGGAAVSNVKGKSLTDQLLASKKDAEKAAREISAAPFKNNFIKEDNSPAERSSEKAAARFGQFEKPQVEVEDQDLKSQEMSSQRGRNLGLEIPEQSQSKKSKNLKFCL